MRQWLRRILVTLAVFLSLFGVIQLIPYGRDHTNPPTVAEPAWDSPRTRELAARACFDCHSNNTRWPNYSHVAPFSWVVQHNVDSARTIMNFSDWTRSWELSQQALSSVLGREMPPRQYLLMHPDAKLTDGETLELARGLQRTFGIPQLE
jgi:hypothetical protein